MEEAKEEEVPPPHLDRIGLFKEMSYHNEYVPMKISFNDASKKGKQMMTNCTKSKAGNQDGYFEGNYPRLFEGEAYLDRIRLNRLYRLENAKKITKTFKYSSPTKRPSGKGSNYGTFMDYDEKLEYFSPQKTDSTKPPSQKNLCVNPPQKGSGYGYPNLTIGKYPPYFLDGEYEELKNTPIEPKKPKDRTFQAYRAGLYQQGYFHPNPYGADELCLEPKEDVEAGEKAKTTIDTPFIPSNPPKKDGGMKAGCLDPFPSHTGELYPRIELIPRGMKIYINDKNQMFRPVPGIRPYPVKSIINKNVQKKVNPKNFSTVKGVVYCKNK